MNELERVSFTILATYRYQKWEGKGGGGGGGNKLLELLHYFNNKHG